MQTVTNAQFIAMFESGQLKWPPFQCGNFLYSQLSGGTELFRTLVPT